jgi:hypothetical protein
MKLRVFACVVLTMMMAVASALWSRMALAQNGSGGQGQQSEQDRGRSGGHSAAIDKALRAYDERMDRNLDKCRKELDQMKKELHELVDLRLDMAMSLAELRSRNPMPGMGFGGPGGTNPSHQLRRPDGGQGSPGHGEGGAESSALSREIQQIHNQLRSEIDQQQNQVAQLAAQLRELKGQGQQGQQRPGQQQPGQGGRAQPGQNQGQSGRGQGQGQGRGQQGQGDGQKGGQSGGF